MHEFDALTRKPVYGGKSDPKQNEIETPECVNGVVVRLSSDRGETGSKMSAIPGNLFRIPSIPSFSSGSPHDRLDHRSLDQSAMARRFTVEK
jgi:hypothetical protein